MKLLVIAPYRQLDGWGQATLDYIKSIRTIPNIELTLRPIYLGHSFYKPDEEIERLEKTVYHKYDAVIQMVLPTSLAYNKVCGKNIGLSFFETNNIQHTGWVRRINMMDSYIVATNKERENLINSGVKIPVHVIGPATDIDKYLTSHEKRAFKDNSFKFYFIGEYNSRKNIHSALMAFHREFRVSEPIDFVIKTNIPGKSREETIHIVNNDISSLKANMRLYNSPLHYKKEILIADFIDEKSINNLHRSCNCLVMPSFGESICRPVLDALGFGKTPIVVENTGSTHYVNDENGYIVKGYEVPLVSPMHPGLVNVYTSRETWIQPDIIDMQKKMREAYLNKDNQKALNGLGTAMEYSYNKTGERIKECLQ